MKPSKNVMLTVGFDADQISDQLVYRYTSTDGAQPVHPTGLFEAEIYFGVGEVFHLTVIGSGRTDSFTSFQIVDCCLITIPKVAYARTETGRPPVTRYAAPSPFLQAPGATQHLAMDYSSEVEDQDQLRLITQHWKHTLNVGDAYGRWKMSLVLTVRIFRGAELMPDIRVFSFDPEGEVGSGRGNDLPGHD
ncbi:hypothetical protein [Duganella sp. Dugasp56]|uniref:hypothetical protein n=1 Tax=Duganella sp. Dugasp56 TaxID=3243046 RepID=UPI00159D5620